MAILGRLYYRVEEVAEILKISVRTAYRAIESNQIPSTRIRGCIRVPVGEFHARFGSSNLTTSASTTVVDGTTSVSTEPRL